MIKKYVITGGPATGKTSTVLALKKKGYAIVKEAARKIIEEEKRKHKEIISWKNVRERQEKILKLQLRLEKKIEKKAEKARSKKKIIFLDRGIPDGIAYFKIAGEKIPKRLLKEARKEKRKYKKIFYLEPIPYKTDAVRKEPEKIAKKLGKLLFQVYKQLDYKIIKVPFMSIAARARFIEKHL